MKGPLALLLGCMTAFVFRATGADTLPVVLGKDADGFVLKLK